MRVKLILFTFLLVLCFAQTSCTSKKEESGSDRAAEIKSFRNLEVDKKILRHDASGETQKENSNCTIPYPTARWKYAYCMTKIESDLTDSPDVQKCVTEAEKSQPTGDPCEQNKYWKNLWCQVSAQKGFVTDRESCLNNATLFPTAVEEGF